MIKVGDWVKVENEKRIHHGMIGRVKEKHNSEWYVQFEPLSKFEFSICKTEDLQKLPIKFKGFKVIPPVFENMDSIDEFRFVNRIKYHFTVGLFFERYYASWFCVKDFTCNKTAGFTTIDQARDWLELQYATMIAKARGLV